MPRKTKSDMIWDKLDEIHQDVREVRTEDIPKLKIDIAVVKAKSSIHAKVVAAIGGIIAVAISSAIALIR